MNNYRYQPRLNERRTLQIIAGMTRPGFATIEGHDGRVWYNACATGFNMKFSLQTLTSTNREK